MLNSISPEESSFVASLLRDRLRLHLPSSVGLNEGSRTSPHVVFRCRVLRFEERLKRSWILMPFYCVRSLIGQSYINTGVLDTTSCCLDIVMWSEAKPRTLRGALNLYESGARLHNTQR